ncbi:hypothetical protein A2U01_0114712, partial [Trifolium medium]|nr:hypothetical protein [Trifolium medium]
VEAAAIPNRPPGKCDPDDDCWVENAYGFEHK